MGKLFGVIVLNLNGALSSSQYSIKELAKCKISTFLKGDLLKWCKILDPKILWEWNTNSDLFSEKPAFSALINQIPKYVHIQKGENLNLLLN